MSRMILINFYVMLYLIGYVELDQKCPLNFSRIMQWNEEKKKTCTRECSRRKIQFHLTVMYNFKYIFNMMLTHCFELFFQLSSCPLISWVFKQFKIQLLE